MEHGVDIETIARLFQDRYGLMIAVARKYAPSADLIYDIVQQAFIDFVEDARKGNRDFSKDITPLIYQITKNRALKAWREYSRHSSEKMRLLAEHLGRQEVSPDDDQVNTTELAMLRRCMEKLPEQSQKLIEQHYLQGVPMEEIARSYSRKPETIRSVFHRLRVKLRQCMEKNAQNISKD